MGMWAPHPKLGDDGRLDSGWEPTESVRRYTPAPSCSAAPAAARPLAHRPAVPKP